MNLDKLKSSSGIDILEEFLKKFIEEENYCTKAVSLSSFVRSYVQEENPEHAAQLICPKVPQLFAALTQFDKTTTYDADKEVKALNLQSALLCLDALLVFNKHLNDPLLIQTTLKVLFQAYTHCERSEYLYNDAFEEFTDQLAVFYQKVQDVQNRAFLHLDNRLLDDEDEVVCVGRGLGELCVLVSRLDTMVAAKIWRAFAKFVTQYATVVEDKLEMDSVITSLLASVSRLISENKDKLKNQGKIEDLDVKILLFLLNLVLKLTHVFKCCLNDKRDKVVNLLLELYSLFIIVCSIEGVEHIMLRNALLTSTHFYSDSSFLTYILESSAVDEMAWLFVLMSAIKRFNCDRGPEQNKALFEGVFKSLQKCNSFEQMFLINLKLSQQLFGGADKEKTTTLYDEIYESISEFSKMIPDSYFSTSVKMLFFNATSDVASLLISDIWIYRLRSSTIETIHTCCSNLDGMDYSNIYLKMLYRRLLKFLPLKVWEKKIPFSDEPSHHRYAIPRIFTVPPPSSRMDLLIFLMDELKKPASKEEPKLVQKADCILEIFSLLVDVAKNEDILRFSEFAKILFRTEVYEIQIAVLTFLKALKCKQLTHTSPNVMKATTHSLASLLCETLVGSNYVVHHVAMDMYFAVAQSTRHPHLFQAPPPHLHPTLKAYAQQVPLSGFLSDRDRIKDFQTQLPCTAAVPVRRDCRKVLYQLK